MNYKDVKVTVNHKDAELVCYAFNEFGSDGVSVLDANDVLDVIRAKSSWDYYDKSLEKLDTSNATIAGGFPEDFDERRLLEYVESLIGYKPESFVEILPVEDWNNSWKDVYAPLDFGKVVVVPEWLDGDYDKPKVLIDPGMGFGTGLHETTGMCIKLLSDVNLAGKKVVDVGCGSGILGIAALKLGCEECAFIDIDPDAVKACRRNVRINKVKGKITLGDLTNKCGERFDVILANLTADILIRLSSDINRISNPGAQLILSGIIGERKDEVIKRFLSLGCKGSEILEEGDWVALSFTV